VATSPLGLPEGFELDAPDQPGASALPEGFALDEPAAPTTAEAMPISDMTQKVAPAGTVEMPPEQKTPLEIAQDRAPPHQQLPRAQAVEEPGFFDRLGQDAERRKQAILQSQDLPNFLISSARAGVGHPVDIVAEGYKSIPEAIRNPIETIATLGMEEIGRIPTSGKATFGDVGRAAMQAGSAIAERNPTLANLAGYLTEATLAKPAVRTAYGAVPLAGTAEDIIRGLAAPGTEARRAKATAGTKKLESNIEKAKQSGESIIPALATNMNRKISGLVDPTNPSMVKAHPESLAAIKRINKIVKNNQTDLKTLITERNNLTEIAKNKTDDGAMARKIRTALDQAIENSDTGASKLYSDSMAKYHMAKTYEDMVNKFNPVMNNPAALRKRAEAMIGSKSFQYLPEEVKTSVREMAKTKINEKVLNAFQLIANKLPVIGDLTGMTIGLVTKPISKTISKGKVSNVFAAVEKAGKNTKGRRALEEATDIEAANPTQFTDNLNE